MTPIAFLVLSGASLMVALHAFVTYPLSLMAVRAWKRRHAGNRDWARSTTPHRFAICTYLGDASELSEAKLSNLLAIRASKPNVQLLMFVDGDPAGLRALLEPHAGSVELHSSPLPRGRSYAMSALASRTRADVLVFAHAHAMLQDHLLDSIDAHLSDREVGCVCATVEHAAGEDATRTVMTQYRRLDAWIRALETDTGSTMGADGCLFAVRAALYHPAPANALHDMHVSMMVLCGGHRVVCAADLRVQADTQSTSRSAFRERHDIAHKALRVHRAMWPMLSRLDGLTQYKYVSHKLLRWFSVYLFATASGCFVLAQALSGHMLPAAVLVVAATVVWLLGQRMSLTPFAQAFEMLSALTGTGMGAVRALLRSD